MHTVILSLSCNPGLRDLVVAGLGESLADTRKFDGCLLVEVYTDQDDPNKILLWEKWESRAHQEKYLAWRIETGMMETLAPVLAEPAQFLHLDGTHV